MISPKIFHLFGPFAINAYGLFIALGVSIGIFLTQKDRILKRYISIDQLHSLTLYIILFGILGGRFLSVIENGIPFGEFFYFWQPGYSILGSIIGATVAAGTYLGYHQLKVINILDRIAIYIPLVQSIARIGCFFAGCCYGVKTTLFWAVRYTDPESLAPLHEYFHPTQLYSSVLLFCLFLILFQFKNYFKKSGELLGLYFMGVSLERFFVDFLRADHKLVISCCSSTQLIAIGIFCMGLFTFSVAHYAQRARKSL